MRSYGNLPISCIDAHELLNVGHAETAERSVQVARDGVRDEGTAVDEPRIELDEVRPGSHEGEGVVGGLDASNANDGGSFPEVPACGANHFERTGAQRRPAQATRTQSLCSASSMRSRTLVTSSTSAR